SSDQFVRPAIGVNAVDHERYHGIGLQAPPRRSGVASCHLAEEEPVGLVLALYLVDQHPAKLGLADVFGGFYKHVRLPRDDFGARRAAAMAIRIRESFDGRTRH